MTSTAKPMGMKRSRRHVLGGAGLLAATFLMGPGLALAQDVPSEATWDSIRPDIFGERAIDGEAVVKLGAPARAEDAALVPVELQIGLPVSDARTVTAVTLVVDENPSPLVAVFKLGEGRRQFGLSTRIRVNSYSYVRAISETSDGKLHMTKAYVKAAGGCSAPAGKDPVEAKANLGKMRFRDFSETGSREAQVQIRHPNYSGMQMDQVTRLYTPAWFVQTLAVSQGGKPLFSMVGGISLSEDPTFRFSYDKNGEAVSVDAKDTEGNDFKRDFPADGGS
ncbi:quinoprotein dehydrogenase-associated SoxYZ-like carrier [Labrys neptuniae]